MTRALTLTDFSSAASDPSQMTMPLQPTAAEPAPAPEVDALESYDAGYKSGWADCAAAEAEERRTIAADLSNNLSAAELTYEAARRDVLAALGPLFEDVAATLLPKIAAAALVPTVLAELGVLAEGQTNAQIELRAAPASCAALERLAETENLSGLTVRAEPAFAEGQVAIHFGTEQRDLDIAGAADRIAEAISAFSEQPAKNESHSLSQGAA